MSDIPLPFRCWCGKTRLADRTYCAEHAPGVPPNINPLGDDSMQRFRQDNTEGYSDADLVAMNEAFERSVNMRLGGKICGLNPSLLDHLAEEVQFAFDQGFRDYQLVR
jgi:hypothetical protein